MVFYTIFTPGLRTFQVTDISEGYVPFTLRYNVTFITEVKERAE